jgi:hypothetical protein
MTTETDNPAEQPWPGHDTPPPAKPDERVGGGGRKKPAKDKDKDKDKPDVEPTVGGGGR